MAATPVGNYEWLSCGADQCRDKATGLYSLLEFTLLLRETASRTTGDCCTFQGVSGVKAPSCLKVRFARLVLRRVLIEKSLGDTKDS